MVTRFRRIRPDKRIVVTKQPIGVCAAITPWNFPGRHDHSQGRPGARGGLPDGHQTVELRRTRRSRSCVLAEKAGVPPGVISVVTGDPKPIGGEFTRNPLVRKLSFTGSDAGRQATDVSVRGTVKKVSLELGGNAPFIVFDDADLEPAVNGAIASKYRNSWPDLRLRESHLRSERHL